MSAGLRHVLVALAIVALALLSHGRLFRAGWLGGDLRLLHAAQEAAHGGTIDGGSLREGEHGWLDEGRVRPVPAVVLVAHARAFEDRGFFSPLHARSLRIVALVVLLAAAAAAGFALRRALVPWVGGDTARAAGFALALFFATHPLGTAAVARAAALGDLFAILFSALAAFLFLRGRQQREKRWVFGAGVAAVLAGFSSPLAVLLPIVLAALELGSARRPRTFVQRARTAITTLVVFTACVMVENVCASLLHLPARRGFGGAMPGWPEWGDAPRALEACVEKLGILFLPVADTQSYAGGVDTPPSPWPSYLVSVALVLFALWPVLRSARAAPRLWGWLGLAWILAMMIALVPHASVRVEPGDYSHAEILVGAMLFACAGIAVASTALLGTRRILLPAAIAIGFAWLGAQAASGFQTAARHVTGMHADLEKALALGGPRAHVLMVDQAERRANLELGVDEARLLVERRAGSAAPFFEPRMISGPAVEILARTVEFATWRKDGLVLVGPDSSIRGDDESGARWVHLVPPTEGSGPPVTWLHKNQSPLFDVDPGAIHAARFVAQAGQSTSEAPRIAWRVTEPAGERLEAIGLWLEGETAPVAVFDLARSWDWWEAPSVRRVETESPFLQVASAELLADIPLEIGSQSERGDDWTFALVRATLAKPLRGEAEYNLDLLDLATLDFARIEVHASSVSAADSTTLNVVAPGAAGFERRSRQRGGGPLVWSLDRRVGGTTIARASGRR